MAIGRLQVSLVGGSHSQDPLFTYTWYERQDSLRRLGHGGSSVGTLTPGTFGRMRLEGLVGEKTICTFEVEPTGRVWLNDHTGCAPLGAAIVTFTREPARYTCPSKYSGMTTRTN